ncbi:hypothetical protein Ancab_012880 [Ancistrocladus abbreviatus]
MAVLGLRSTLKTAKKAYPSTPSTPNNYESLSTLLKTLITSPSHPIPTTTATSTTVATTTSNAEAVSLLSNLSSKKLHLILSNPTVKTSICLQLFNLICENQSLLSFKPGLHTHLTLICRLIKSRKFTEAENLIKNVAVDQNYRYPFSNFVNWVGNYCKESKIITKLLNMILKVYSDNQMFDMASTTFDYMKNNRILIDERTCTCHLFALIRCDQFGLALEFFWRMVNSGVEVSVFSLTAMVDGLCKIGEVKMARELVEQMVGRGIVKPNIITFNTLLDACAKRWKFGELDLVLVLMEKEGIGFNDSTYKFLIDGYSSYGKVEEATWLVLEMHDKGLKVDAYLYSTVIRGYFRLRNLEGGLSLLSKMEDMGLSPNADMWRSLIDDLCWMGEMDVAKELVNKMQNNGGELDKINFNALLEGYRKKGMTDEALKLQDIMKKKGLIVDEFPYNLTDSEFELLLK